MLRRDNNYKVNHILSTVEIGVNQVHSNLKLTWSSDICSMMFETDLLPNLSMELKPRTFLTSLLVILQYSHAGPPCIGENKEMKLHTLIYISFVVVCTQGLSFPLTL